MNPVSLISMLLDYPTEALRAFIKANRQKLELQQYLPTAQIQELEQLFNWLEQDDVLAVQESWENTFDQGRQSSLLMYEHVHGESRDRGQAMVDLLHQYEADGFEFCGRELPDYLPVYLEYLSCLEAEPMQDGLRAVAPVLTRIGQQLNQVQSPYRVCFEWLLGMSGINEVAFMDQPTPAPQASMEEFLERLDGEWAEADAFSVSDAAASCRPNPPPTLDVPVHWVGFQSTSISATINSSIPNSPMGMNHSKQEL